MTTVIVGMIVALSIAGLVVALVAVPAHKQGRDVLTPQGGQLVQSARERTVEVVETARDRVGEKVGDLTDKLPGRDADARSGGESADVDLRQRSSDAGPSHA